MFKMVTWWFSELSCHVQEFLPDDYYRRRHTDGRSRYMSHPLPSKPAQPPPGGIMQVGELYFKHFVYTVVY